MSRICSGICSGISNNISWGVNALAKLTDKNVTAWNVASSLIGYTIFLEKMPPYLKQLSENFPSLSMPANWLADRIVPTTLRFYKGRFEALKDSLTVILLFETANEVLNPEKKLWEVDEKTHKFKNSISKIGNRCTKLIYSSIEVFLIIPNKYEMIDLGKWCSTIGTWSSHLSWVTTTNIFIVKDVLVVVASSLGIWNNTQEINKASSVVEKNKNRLARLKEIENAAGNQGLVIKLVQAYELGKDKKIVVEKLSKEVFALHNNIQGIKETIKNLEMKPQENADKITEKTLKLQKLQDEVVRKEEKIKRIRNFANAYSTTNPMDDNADKAQKFQQVLSSKIKKAVWRITINESQETKLKIARWFEISKIAIVTLGLLFLTGLTLTYLASFAAAIAAATWITGLGVSCVGTVKTIYDVFYWKDPKDCEFKHANLLSV